MPLHLGRSGSGPGGKASGRPFRSRWRSDIHRRKRGSRSSHRSRAASPSIPAQMDTPSSSSPPTTNPIERTIGIAASRIRGMTTTSPMAARTSTGAITAGGGPGRAG
ncbi:hypothetical protein EVJ50_12595 [Synechococcus sp. RSCCF101]|nr:hypothetical protein EVJ50_12595 [Synechococcus sp. RSCCF101]